MIYLSSFKLSNQTLKNPNIYPYNIFRDKYIEPFSFAPITIFYGNNGCGKSTLLNIIAGKLKIIVILKVKIFYMKLKKYNKKLF